MLELCVADYIKVHAFLSMQKIVFIKMQSGFVCPNVFHYTLYLFNSGNCIVFWFINFT